ncbi:MAG: signal peptidase I [Paludibacter sp.]|jgi:ATP-binding cassette subfamily B protein|nr:signal peptidase I [Paludibacter sp.]
MNNQELNENMYDVAVELLSKNHSLNYRTKGMSMYPTLRPGDKAIVEKCEADKCKRGDIVVFRQDNKLICHRIIKSDFRRGELSILTKGDNCRKADKPFTSDSLLGIVRVFERDAKQRSFDDNRHHISKFIYQNLPKSGLIYNRMHHLLSKAFISVSSLRTNFPMVIQHSEKLFWLNAIISVLQGILPFVTLVLIKFLIDVLTKQNYSANIWLLLSATAVSFIVTAIISELKTFYSEKISQSVSKNIYQKLQQRHSTLALSHYENPEHQDKIHRAVQEASYRPLKIVNAVLNAIKSVSSAVILLLLFVFIRWYLIFILIAAVLPGMISRIYFSQKNYRLKKDQSQREREMYYYNRILTGIPFAKELKLFSFMHYFLNRFRKVQNRLFDERIKLRRSEMRVGIASQIFAVMLIFISLGVVAFLNINGKISIGTLVMFFFAFQRGYTVLSEFFKAFTQIAEDNIFLQDFSEFLNSTLTEKRAEPIQEFSLTKGISIRNLNFSYENSRREALHNINLEIPAGKTVALVGANGSGKTTLIKLLCGFYEAVSGQILYDNKNAIDIGQENICRNISAVFQDFALYNIPAIENLYLGDFSREFDENKARKAAETAGVAEVLSGLSQGYKTMLGNLFKGGEELSVGQWQKIAIARAIYRDAPLLLFDEPSSALDATSEQEILAKLREFSRGKTTIIISHRLSSVQWADKICVLDKGTIVEEGTHEQLIEQRGKYYQLYSASKSNGSK